VASLELPIHFVFQRITTPYRTRLPATGGPQVFFHIRSQLNQSGSPHPPTSQSSSPLCPSQADSHVSAWLIPLSHSDRPFQGLVPWAASLPYFHTLCRPRLNPPWWIRRRPAANPAAEHSRRKDTNELADNTDQYAPRGCSSDSKRWLAIRLSVSCTASYRSKLLLPWRKLRTSKALCRLFFDLYMHQAIRNDL
jgi:hypothetical protein